MKFLLCLQRLPSVLTLLITPAVMMAPLTGAAENAGSQLRFQRPSQVVANQRRSEPKFRPAAPRTADVAAETSRESVPSPVVENSLRESELSTQPVAQVAASRSTNSNAPQVRVETRAARPVKLASAAVYREGRANDSGVEHAGYQSQTIVPSFMRGHASQVGFCAGCLGSNSNFGSCDSGCGICDSEPACGVSEPGCGIVEPGCGIVDPGCGIAEPGCGIAEPGCGIAEPGCGIEPSCGCDEIGCGSCVGRTGSDYWCFPVCFPRFKELNVWAGVHGFKGPRDTIDGGPTDGNFGFQEGLNIGGRLPYIGLLFPQLGYQLGYQAVQSQLSGNTLPSSDSRSQDFLTFGLFRRVPAGWQFGVAWDYMDDNFIQNTEFSQVRYEVSLKGRGGREIGFWGANHTSDDTVGSTVFQTVDQYAMFIRWNFREGAALRFWGGGTNDSEGIFGADMYAPLNNRWSVQSGFNYLITDAAKGSLGAQEESWNIGINLVWHFGCTAKKLRYNPYAPLFNTADNGIMFVDQKP